MGKLVEEGYRGTVDSNVENAINVYNDNRSYIKFICVQNRLYCIDLDNSGDHCINNFTIHLLLTLDHSLEVFMIVIPFDVHIH